MKPASYGIKRRTSPESLPAIDALEAAQAAIAAIVRDHGERYLPIFERIHGELEAARKQKTMLDIALGIAGTTADGSTAAM